MLVNFCRVCIFALVGFARSGRNCAPPVSLRMSCTAKILAALKDQALAVWVLINGNEKKMQTLKAKSKTSERLNKRNE